MTDQPPDRAQQPAGSTKPLTSQVPPQPPKPKRRRTGLWLGIVGGVVALVVIVAVVVILAAPKPAPSNTGGLPATAFGPNACAATGKSAPAAGPWKLISPKTLCGLPKDTSAQSQQGDKELLSATQLVFAPSGGPSIGTATSGFAIAYEAPRNSGLGRFITFVGFTGTFNQQAALSALAYLSSNPDIPGNVYHAVPAGPHGGAMECAPNYTAEDCVFATSTTLAHFEISDSTKELTGSHTNKTAIEIRDAMEAAAG